MKGLVFSEAKNDWRCAHASMHAAGRVFKDNVGDDAGIDCDGLVGTEADADVEWRVNGHGDGRAELVHGFAGEADEDGDRVAVFLNADAPGGNVRECAAEPTCLLLPFR